MAKEKERNTLKEVIKSLEKKYGDGIVMKLDDSPRCNVDAISTGSISLNHATGIGGIPVGRIVEVFGPESSGKTTLALNVVAEAQKKKFKCAYIDVEHALDPAYAEKLGVKIKELFISQPDSAEQALDVLVEFIRTGELKVIVLDSVAALVPNAENDADMGKQFMGLQARMMSQALRKITPLAHSNGTTIIFINQIRKSIGVVYGNPEYTPGGTALAFYASMRIDIRREAKLQKGEEFVGNRVRVKIVKNKLAAPFKVAKFDVMYNEGIQKEDDLIQAGMLCNRITKTGNSYFYDDLKLGGSTEKAKTFLKNDKDTFDKIYLDVTNSLTAMAQEAHAPKNNEDEEESTTETSEE